MRSSLKVTWTQVGGLAAPGWVAWVSVSGEDPKHPMTPGESLRICPEYTIRCIINQPPQFPYSNPNL